MDGKGHNFATNAESQIIQPYSDHDKFFLEQWVFANYHSYNNDEPGLFKYYVEAPAAWPEVDKQRVEKHFRSFGLARRYATKAAEALGTVLAQIKRFRQAGLDDQAIMLDLLTPGVDEVSFANHWQKGMYQALTSWLGAR